MMISGSWMRICSESGLYDTSSAIVSAIEGEVLFMRKKLQMFMMILGLMVQMLTVLLFSFTELPIPAFVYLIVWVLCARLFFERDVV